MHKHKSKVWNKYVRYLYRSGTSGSLANFGPWGNWDETSPARDRSSSLLPVHSPASTVLLWSSLLVYFHFLTVHEQKNGYQKAIFTMTAFLVSLERSCVESRILKSWGRLDGYSRMKSDREDNLKCRRSWVRRGLCFPLEGKKIFQFLSTLPPLLRCKRDYRRSCVQIHSARPHHSFCLVSQPMITRYWPDKNNRFKFVRGF